METACIALFLWRLLVTTHWWNLRLLTSVELFLHSNFYCQHPNLSVMYDKHKDKYFNSFKNLLCVSVSHSSVHTDMRLKI